jgi:hypothetical protein
MISKQNIEECYPRGSGDNGASDINRSQEMGEFPSKCAYKYDNTYNKLCKPYPYTCETCIERLSKFIAVQARDQFYCDIGGVRIPYTQKEYERQTMAKAKEPIRIKKKKITRGSISKMVNRLSRSKVLAIQSMDIEEVDTEQQINFISQDPGETEDIGHMYSDIASADATADVSLSSFLERPTLIHSTTWSEGAVPGIISTIKPWYLYFNNARIKKKIDNFAFIRCTLHVKVLINASPFYYGMAMVNYNPLEDVTYNPVRTTAIFPIDLLTWSQMPNIKLTPSKSAGGEMILPFFNHKNWIKLATTDDSTNMGTMRLIDMTGLRSANGVVGTSVSVQFYAWATDVELMGPTANLALQSADEYGDGIVSGPASTIAVIADAFSNTPVIGRFAKATEIGATATSAIAKLFGFTNVPVIDNVHAFQNSNLPHLASAQIGTAVQKLTYDPKCELSVDPSIHGVDEDDALNINKICSHESLLATIPWTTSDLTDENLFNARVNPILCSSLPIAGGTRVAHTPASYIGRLFQYWRGDIVFRFQIVCSQYHKGRIRITYDPAGRIDIDPDTQNIAYTTIVDVGVDNDTTITVPYHQAASFLRVAAVADNWNSGDPLAPDENTFNGLISVRVLNALTAPVAIAPVRILVYVQMGDNFEYAVPMSGAAGIIPPSIYSVQSKDEVDPVFTVMGPPTKSHPKRFLMNFGESMVSLRTLLHRSTKSESTPFVNLATNTYMRYRQLYGRMPSMYGYDYNGLNLAAGQLGGTAQMNFVHDHPLPYITAMFKGYRGSINLHLNVNGSDYTGIDELIVSRHGDGRNLSDRVGGFTDSLGLGPVFSARMRFLNCVGSTTGAGGLALTSTRNNNSLSVSMPDFNRYNFNLFSPHTINLGSIKDDSDTNTYATTILFSPTTDAIRDSSKLTLSKYVSAGVDYMPLFFLCAPTLDYYTSLPGSA